MNQPVENEELAFEITVKGEAYTELPKDLYIPPDALRVFLEAFQGPLDLLLYLIKKQQLDILDIPIAKITAQYMHYVELMREINIDLAGEYLLMAALLAEIKSRLLLPRPTSAAEELEDDPRAELIRRLQEYERFRQAAANLDQLERLDRDIFTVDVDRTTLTLPPAPLQVSLQELSYALQEVLKRAKLYTDHTIESEKLSIRQRMTAVLNQVNSHEFTNFTAFFSAKEGAMGVSVTLIAILELIKQATIELVQAKPFAPIYVKARSE